MDYNQMSGFEVYFLITLPVFLNMKIDWNLCLFIETAVPAHNTATSVCKWALISGSAQDQ